MRLFTTPFGTLCKPTAVVTSPNLPQSYFNMNFPDVKNSFDLFGSLWLCMMSFSVRFLIHLATLPDDVLLPDITCIAWYDLNK